MLDLLINPGIPSYLVGIAGLLLATAGLQGWQPRVIGLRPIAPASTTRSRFLLGQAGGGLVAFVIILAALATAPNSTTMLLFGCAALAAYLYFGLVLPRKPQVQAEQRRQLIRQLTPGFVSYVRVALAGYDSPAQILERYTGRLDPRSSAMREVTAAALEVMQRQRQRPFAALRDQARITGCRELIDLTEALAQAESEGAPIDKILQQHEQTLMALLDDEFKRMLKRRTMYLLLLVAISVVIGILGNLLYVMVGSVFFKGA